MVNCDLPGGNVSEFCYTIEYVQQDRARVALLGGGKELAFHDAKSARNFDPEASLKLMEVVNDLLETYPEAQLGTELIAEVAIQLLEYNHEHRRIQPIAEYNTPPVR